MKKFNYISSLVAGSLLMLPAFLAADSALTVIPEVPGGQPGFGGSPTGGYAPVGIDAKFNIDVDKDTHTVRMVRDNQDPYTITKAYEVKNANPFAVRGYLLNVVKAKSLRTSPVSVDALKFNDGTGLVIVSAEEYRFTDNATGEGIDTIIKKLDRKDLSFGGNTNSFLYFPKANTAAGLLEMVANVGASISDNEFSAGIDTLRVDSELNALIVSAPMWSWKHILKMLKAYDNPAPEVKISYEVYEVYSENDDKIGLDFQSWKNNDGVDLFATGARMRRNWSTLFTGSPQGTKWNNTHYWSFQPKWNTRYVDLMTARGHAKLLNRGMLVAKNREVTRFALNYGYFYDQTDAAYVVDANGEVVGVESNYMKPNVDIIQRQAVSDIMPETKLAELSPYLYQVDTTWRMIGQLASDTTAYSQNPAVIQKQLAGAAVAMQKKAELEAKGAELAKQSAALQGQLATVTYGSPEFMAIVGQLQQIQQQATALQAEGAAMGEYYQNGLAAAQVLNQVYWNKNPLTGVKGTTSIDTSNAMAGIIHGKLQIPAPASGFKFEMQVLPVVTGKATQLDFSFSGVSLIGWNGDGTPRLSNSETTTRVQLTNNYKEMVVSDIQKVEVVRGVAGLPILKDLPVLGWVFGDENESTKKSRLIVVLRAEYSNPKDKIPAEVQQNINKIVDGVEKGWKSPINNLGFQQLLIDTDEWK